MHKRSRWAISVITVAGLVAVGAAGGISISGNPVSRHVALVGDQSVGFGINLDDCPVLAEGYHGGCASQLQAELKAYDNADLAVDHVFGDTTRRAVIAFQQKHGIVPADGIVGPVTKAALDAAAGSPLPTAQEPGRTEPAQAATVDRYRVQLAAWIPQASVTGPQPDNKCFGYITTLATYNGNNHVGFDGEYKGTVTYDFTYDGSHWADIAVNTRYGPTYADDGICTYHGQATSAAGVSPITGGVKMWIRSKNPLVGVAPPIIANIDLSFSGTDQMIIVDHSNRFPSHGFRVWKNDRVIATAVDYDVSCETVTGELGAINIGKQLSTGAKVVTHHLDLRVAGQDYFGPCGKRAPAPFSYPVSVPPSVPTPVPGN